jgi:parallel beta-helix repeat protein
LATRLRLHTGLALAAAAAVAIGGLGLAVSPPRDTPAAQLSPLPSAPLPTATPADVFVDPAGDDAAAGTMGSPLLTVQAAVDRVAPGQTVWLEAGSYGPFQMHRSGTAENPISVAARRQGSARIAAVAGAPTVDLAAVSNIALLNLDIEGPDGSLTTAVRIDRSSAVLVEGSTVHGTRGGFGIDVRYSADITVRSNDIQHNAAGIRLYGEQDPSSVHDVLIEANRIHDNDSMLLNDPAPDNDYGGNGIIWHKVSGPTVARANMLWGNRAASHDYGSDGGAFEIWGSSNLEISGNVAWDNVNVLETGSDGPDCANILFRRNVAFVTTSGVGLLLRCARDSVFANNVLDGMDSYAFELSDHSGGSQYAGSIAGLRIVDNIVVGSPVYAVRNELPDGLVLDYNLFDATRPVARFPRAVTRGTLRSFTEATGYERHSISANPGFADQAARDYRVKAGSPALDHGVVVLQSDAFLGEAPDIGAFEGPASSESPSATTAG